MKIKINTVSCFITPDCAIRLLRITHLTSSSMLNNIILFLLALCCIRRRARPRARLPCYDHYILVLMCYTATVSFGFIATRAPLDS